MKFNVKHGPGTMGSLVQLWNAGPQEVVGCSTDFNSLLQCFLVKPPEVGPAGGGGTQLAGGPSRFVVGQQWGFKSWDLQTPSIFPSEAESKYIQIYPNPRNSGTSLKLHQNPSKSIKIHQNPSKSINSQNPSFCKLPGSRFLSEPFWLQGCRPFLAAHWHVPGATHANPCWLS
jgi:hypothetical protein